MSSRGSDPEDNFTTKSTFHRLVPEKGLYRPDKMRGNFLIRQQCMWVGSLKVSIDGSCNLNR